MSNYTPVSAAPAHLSAPPSFLLRRDSTHPCFASPLPFSRLDALPNTSSPSPFLNSAATHDVAPDPLLQLLEDLEFPSFQDCSWLEPLMPSIPFNDSSVNSLRSLSAHSPASPTLAGEAKTDFRGSVSLEFNDTDSASRSYAESWIGAQPGICARVASAGRRLTPPPSRGARLVRSTRKSVKRKQPREEAFTRTNVKVFSRDESMYDGYRWKKYGKRALKESPYPRSYFKCTAPGCTARKQVEHSLENPSLILTTYDGTHNHDPPPLSASGVIMSVGMSIHRPSGVVDVESTVAATAIFDVHTAIEAHRNMGVPTEMQCASSNQAVANPTSTAIDCLKSLYEGERQRLSDGSVDWHSDFASPHKVDAWYSSPSSQRGRPPRCQ